MSGFTTFFYVVLLILVVLTIFNIAIFVHELGHFLAAKWRGLQIDRFQIWFGKPLWKKNIGGVQYGLGWIPAGGFVALPQMAPMQAIEGGDQEHRQLAPISTTDKIIVAFAGPLFSVLLALVSALVVYQVGKPRDFIPETQIGYVEEGSPAEKAGLQPGDRVLEINDQPVEGFQGSLESVRERIVLSRGDRIEFTIDRPGVGEMEVVTGFETEKTHWFQRRALRQVGIEPAHSTVIAEVMEGSPAERAGIRVGDELVSANGTKLYGILHLSQILERNGWGPVALEVKSPAGEVRAITVAPEKPVQPADAKPMLGVAWDYTQRVDVRIVHPGPFEQMTDSLKMMWITITSVMAKDSGIGIDHLSGPIGIGTLLYDFLQTENGWRRILAFMVLLNVNLAVLNMLPFPVLDGGHITIALLEKIARRPVKPRPLEVIQTFCALALISLMLYVASKDIGDHFGRGGSAADRKVIFKGE